MNALSPSLIYTEASLLCAGIGSIYDVRERRIPNFLTGPAILAGVLLHGVAGGWMSAAESALAGLIAGGIFLVFFMAGGMGGGDVKLMAAVGCLVGLSPLRLVLLSTVFIGAICAVGVALYNGRLRQTLRNVGALVLHHGQQGLTPHPDLNLLNKKTLRLPFALPIAAGCLLTLCAAAWGVRP